MERRGLALCASIVLVLGGAGCVEKIAEHRVRAALVDAGLSEANAGCMARRMVDRLTISQLRKLEAFKGEKRTMAEYLSAVRQAGDREVIMVTAGSAALCTTGLAH